MIEQQPKPTTDLHHREAAALSPAIRSLITAALACAATLWLTLLLSIDPLPWVSGAFLLAFAVEWFRQSRRLDELTKPAAPSILFPAPVTPVVHRMEVWLNRKDAGGMGSSECAEFEVSPNTMRTLAQGLLAGRPFTRAVWVANRTLTDDQHRKIKKKMLDIGLLRLKNERNPKAGTELTSDGIKVMTEAANMPASTTRRNQ